MCILALEQGEHADKHRMHAAAAAAWSYSADRGTTTCSKRDAAGDGGWARQRACDDVVYHRVGRRAAGMSPWKKVGK